jgi:hypothetical protein
LENEAERRQDESWLWTVAVPPRILLRGGRDSIVGGPSFLRAAQSAAANSDSNEIGIRCAPLFFDRTAATIRVPLGRKMF